MSRSTVADQDSIYFSESGAQLFRAGFNLAASGAIHGCNRIRYARLVGQRCDGGDHPGDTDATAPT
jgi:hypothetical protein